MVHTESTSSIIANYIDDILHKDIRGCTVDSRYCELEGTRQKVHYIRRFTITRVHKIRS